MRRSFSHLSCVYSIGGAAYSWDVGGCGGGGRIAIFYDSMSLPDANLYIRSGTGGVAASAGTIYLKDNAQPLGSVVLSNNGIDCPLFTPWKSALPSFQTLTLRNRARLQTIASDDVTFNEVHVESISTLLLDTNTAAQTPVVNIDGATLTTNVDRSFPVGTDLRMTSGGTFNIKNNSTLSVGVLDTMNIKSGTINLQEGCRLYIASKNATIGAGVTFVKDGTFGESDSIHTLTILNGGVLTHSSRLLAGLRLNVLDTLDINPGGTIDVSGKGLLGGQPMVGGGRGEAYNSTGDSIVAGATGSENTGGGGGYGGRGGNGGQGGVSNEPYGLVEDVQHLGAGGGGNRYFWGGQGGGLVKIQANICIMDGVIRANGGEGSGGFDNSGGGSGGGIRMQVGSLSGAGRIEAIGGAAYSWDVGGCGGGGRIAIFYDSMSLPDANLYIRSGTGGVAASAGTIYLKDNAQPLGSVVLSNNGIDCPLFTPWKSALPSFQTLTLRNRARLQTIASDDVTFNEVHVESISTLLLDTNTAAQTPVVNIDGATLTTNVDRSFSTGTDFQLTNGGTINLQNNRTLVVGVFDTTNMKSGTVNITKGSRLDIITNSAMIGAGVTLVKDGFLGVNDSLTSLFILNGGTITHSLRLLAGLRLHVLDTLDVKIGGSIDVSCKGLLGGHPIGVTGNPGETYNDNDSIVDGAGGAGNASAGGSYGGQGAQGTNAVPSSPYGDIEDPRHLGSGAGGNRYWGGGHGGGRATIITNECIVDGAIRANGVIGAGGFDPTGGGSGGAIKILATSVSGIGLIEATGAYGQQYNNYSGSGGGGRIAIFYDSMSFPESNISARGGSSQSSASAGTIYLKDNTLPLGNVIIDNANIVSNKFTPWRSALARIQNLIVKNKAYFEVGSEVGIEGQLLISAGCKIGRR